MTDKPYNAGDESQVKEREKKQKAGRERDLDDLKSILATKSGRRFIWRILCECNVFGICKAMNATIYAQEGKREIGTMLLADVMEIEPKAYLLMWEERKE